MAWTSHGHHIPGTSMHDDPSRPESAGCGGPWTCPTCAGEASGENPDWEDSGIVVYDPPIMATDEVDNDPVNHPNHYTSHPDGIECIQVTRHMNFNLGNVVKYLWRAGQKNGEPDIQDLEKAAWYLRDEITRRKNNV